MQSQPYGLLRDILAWRLQIADSDSMAAAKEKIELGIVPLFERDDGPRTAQAYAHLLGQLIGLDFSDSPHVKGIRDDGQQIRNRGFHACAQLLRRLVARDAKPIVLLLDDLHWADDGTLDFLNYLAEVNLDLPMLVLGLTRPALFERRADWGSPAKEGMGQATRIDLLPLGEDASRALADELLKKLPEIPTALRELITGGAEGNPFYMEELVKMLIDEGAIDAREESWGVIVERLLTTRVPQTLTGVLQARLDGLQPGEKLALQQASVIGAVFWDQALTAIDANATAMLPSLVRREFLVLQHDAGFEGVRAYAFKHHLLHQVTYDTLLKRARRDCHAKAAAWLAGLRGARANDFLGATAEHFEKSGDDAKALEYLARAGEHAASNYANDAAMSHVAHAFALIGANEGEGELREQLLVRWRLLATRERILDLRSQRAEQGAAIEALQRLADVLDDDGRRAEAQWRRSDLALHTGDHRTNELAARQAVALAQRAGNVSLALSAQARLAVALALLGNAASGKALALDGLQCARANGLPILEGRLLNALSVIASLRDDPMLGIEEDRQCVLIERQLGNRRTEARMLCNVGLSLRELGELEQARRCLEESLQLMRSVGDRAAESSAIGALGVIALWQGDAQQALANAQAALAIAVAAQDRVTECYVLLQLGDAELALKHYAAAQAAFDRSLDVALQLNHVYRHDAAAGLARVALARGEVAEALRPLSELLQTLAAGGTPAGAASSALILLSCHRALARAGDERAAGVLAQAHTELLSRAAGITDAGLREAWLNNVPEHREINAAWSAQQAVWKGRS